MSAPLCSLAIATHNDSARALWRALLTQHGHRVVLDANTSERLCRGFNQPGVDLILADATWCNDGDGGILAQFAESVHAPIVLIAPAIGAPQLACCAHPCVFGLLLAPPRPEELNAMIECARRRYNERELLRRDVAQARDELGERKVIERAKGVLMKQVRIDEKQAYDRLRSTARKNRQKIVDVARSVLLTGAILDESGVAIDSAGSVEKTVSRQSS
jgi:response regulator NasT